MGAVLLKLGLLLAMILLTIISGLTPIWVSFKLLGLTLFHLVAQTFAKTRRGSTDGRTKEVHIVDTLSSYLFFRRRLLGHLLLASVS
jgi:hypothetical protein